MVDVNNSGAFYLSKYIFLSSPLVLSSRSLCKPFFPVLSLVSLNILHSSLYILCLRLYSCFFHAFTFRRFGPLADLTQLPTDVRRTAAAQTPPATSTHERQTAE